MNYQTRYNFHRVREEYVYILNQMFIIHLIEPYSTNKRQEIAKMKKNYFSYLGLRNSIYNSFNYIGIRIDKGQLFENFVLLELIKANPLVNVNFYRTKNGSEINCYNTVCL